MGSTARPAMGMAAVSHGDNGDAEADPECICHEERDVQDQGQATASRAEPCRKRQPTNQGWLERPWVNSNPLLQICVTRQSPYCSNKWLFPGTLQTSTTEPLPSSFAGMAVHIFRRRTEGQKGKETCPGMVGTCGSQRSLAPKPC